MKARTRKAIDRMLTRAIPTAPTDGNWFVDLNHVRFRTPNGRQALRKVRAMVAQARPFMKPHELLKWRNL
jgi:hypothetical protein